VTGKKNIIIDLLTREWLLIGSLAGLITSSVYLHSLPHISKADIGILFLLLSLFVTVKGLEDTGFLENIAIRLNGNSFVALKLILITFFASMIFTNDAALIIIVPITLKLRLPHTGNLVIFESLAANAGSALTPFGNPQNLYIYWYYGLGPKAFFSAILPFSLTFLGILVLCGLFFFNKEYDSSLSTKKYTINLKILFYLISNLLVILTILKVIPFITLIGVMLLIAVFDLSCFRIDYGLLLTMLCFLGLSENMKIIFESLIEHSDHIFLLSSLSSQVISNVPAALLFSKFTSNWKALLWGTNVGGFGGLVGSLANLIAYKIYISSSRNINISFFTRRFVIVNYIFFVIGVGLFYVFKGYLY